MTGEVAAVAFGTIAAGLQAAGYFLYLRHALRTDILPNPASWLMFAYGTALVVFLEAASGGAWTVLLLPSVCAGASIGLAALLLGRGASLRDLDRADTLAFTLDVLLTAAYALAWLAQAAGLGGAGFLDAASAVLLAGAAGTSITAFVPILRSTWRAPERERPWPWAVWSAAYALLLAATLRSGAAPALGIYPAVNLALHGAMAVLALRPALKRLRTAP